MKRDVTPEKPDPSPTDDTRTGDAQTDGNPETKDDKEETLRLLRRVRTGDDAAFDMLAAQYRNLTEAAVRRFSASFESLGGTVAAEPDDLRQHAVLALYRAAQTYREDGEGKAVRFGLYAKICINNALISQLRRAKSLEKRASAGVKPRKRRRGASETEGDPLEQFIASEDAAELIRKIRRTLSGMESQVFDLYITGKSVGEIAAQLGREKKSVSNALYRMKGKIKGLKRSKT